MTISLDALEKAAKDFRNIDNEIYVLSKDLLALIACVRAATGLRSCWNREGMEWECTSHKGALLDSLKPFTTEPKG